MPKTETTNRRERKKLATRRHIRDVALHLFETRGYASVTIEQISAEADVSPVTFYRHFHTKEGVIVSVVLSPEVETALAAVPRVTTPSDIDSIFTDFFADSAEWAESLMRRLKLIVSTPELIDALWQRSSQWTDAISATLPVGLSNRILARCLVGATIECALSWAEQSQAHDIGELHKLTRDAVAPLILAFADHSQVSEE